MDGDELIAAWADIDPTLPIHERMQRLEDMMRAWRDSEAAATYLNESVERLGMNASALGEALLKVDQQQQLLTRLGQDISNVEAKSVSYEEVDEKAAAAAAQEVHRDRLRLLGFALALAAMLFVMVFYVSDAAHQACVNRQFATKSIRDTLESFRNPANEKLIDAGLRRLDRTLRESCDEQYIFHVD